MGWVSNEELYIIYRSQIYFFNNNKATFTLKLFQKVAEKYARRYHFYDTFTTLFRLNLSVTFTKSFGHRRSADINLCDTFLAVRRVFSIDFFKKLVFQKRAQIFT